METSIIIPAFNEAQTIRDVILDFHEHIKEARIFVIDNNSSDNTQKIARGTLKKIGNTGEVLFEPQQGKANALRRAFRDIEADIFIVVDADLTYKASDVHKLLGPVIRGEADVVVGDRLSGGDYSRENKRLFHNFGNSLVRNMINALFREKLNDIMSGYRVFSRNFVKNYPILIKGFEIETDMTLHAIQRSFRIAEVPVSYTDRPQGSKSKLNTFSDGLLVLKRIMIIFKNYKPLLFFTICGSVFFLLSIICGMPVIIEFIKTRYIRHVPLAILSTGLMLMACFSFFVGIILDVIVHLFREVEEILYIHSKAGRNS